MNILKVKRESKKGEGNTQGHYINSGKKAKMDFTANTVQQRNRNIDRYVW